MSGYYVVKQDRKTGVKYYLKDMYGDEWKISTDGCWIFSKANADYMVTKMTTTKAAWVNEQFDIRMESVAS